MVMEFVSGGELFDYVVKRGKVREKQYEIYSLKHHFVAARERRTSLLSTNYRWR